MEEKKKEHLFLPSSSRVKSIHPPFSGPFPSSSTGTDRKQEREEEEEKIGLSGLLDRQRWLRRLSQ